MPLPSRSRSLRQPGHVHRDLIVDAQQTASIERHGPGLHPEELDVSEVVRRQSGPESQSPAVNAEKVAGSGNEKPVQERSSFRITTGTSTQRQDPRHIHRQINVKVIQNGDLKGVPTGGGDIGSSGVPFLSQLSRSSSLRQPTAPAPKAEAVKRLHAGKAAIDGCSTTSSRSGTVSTVSLRPAQRDFPTHSLFKPSPKPVSIASKPVDTQRRSQSGVLLKRETDKAFPGVQNRLTSVARPQFSTYQQQFSPRKEKRHTDPVKVPPSTFPASTDFNQITALQDELLQLQWMHHSSHKTLQAWTESGERRIREQYEKHIQDACHVKTLEQKQQSHISGAALRNWLGIGTGKRSFKKVESLAQDVQALTDLTQPHERLQDAIEKFEAWCENTIDTLGERSDEKGRQYPRFIHSLGQSWVDTVAALVRSFESCLWNLQELGPVEESSGLSLVLGGHIRFAQGILDELHAMQLIHSLVLDREDSWIQGKISALLAEKDQSELPSWGSKHPAAWERPDRVA